MPLVFRLTFTFFVIGFTAMLVLGYARREPPPEVEQLVVDPVRAVGAGTTIVDIAGGVPREKIASLVTLAPGERVIAVGERAVDSDLEAGAAIAAVAPSPGTFFDLTVEGARGPRRVLVLVH